ncbi:TolC family outer membrane protein [Parendozoicomonas haliclonae]|uniref:Outer membrane protein TolC n=2 Tax=Parendozoicomonas haliclonae TaxID=1960125 RepID=A0A1X7AFI5_9GAMM|nr:Outer membrane protein TolC precursor [Parendozoicomonas haliclonae]
MLPKRLLVGISAAMMAPAITLFSGALHAASGEPVDLMQVYELAVKNDAQLAAARASFKAAEEAVPQSRAALLPQIGLSAQTADNKGVNLNSTPLPAGDRTNNYNTHGWSASLTQPLFNLQSWFAFEQAGYLTEQAGLSLAIEQQSLVLRVAQAYFNVLLAEETLATTIAEEKALQRQLEQTQQRFEVGLIAETDVLEARAAYDQSRVTRIQANNQVSVAYENLWTLTNTSITKLESLDKTMPVSKPTPAIAQEWVKTSVAQNLSLEASRKGIDAASSQLKVSKSGHAPTLNAVATYGHNVNYAQPDTNDKNNSTVYSLQLSVPIFSGGATQSKVRQAGYQLEETQLNYDQSLRTVTANTRNLFNTVNADAENIDAQCRAIESANSALKATESGYEVGTRNIVDVLNAQQNLYGAQRNYLSARYDFIINTLKLKQNAGTLSPQDLKDLNNWMNTSGNNDLTSVCTKS